LNATVSSARIEELPPLGANIISARALTDLDGLLEFVERHMDVGGTAFFPKGETWKKELESAQENWS